MFIVYNGTLRWESISRGNIDLKVKPGAGGGGATGGNV